MDADRIRPFWAAVLGYVDVDGSLVDPDRLGSTFWFQEMTEPRTERQRFHIDVTVPARRGASARIAAASSRPAATGHRTLIHLAISATDH